MITSIFDQQVQATLDRVRAVPAALTASPEDWRDVWIYFLMLDRFDNPRAPPVHPPYDSLWDRFQGGSYRGVQARLPYLKDLGAGAIWLSPVLKNPRFDEHAYHGYGIQNFLCAEPRFASDPGNADAELRELVDEAHRLGMYVIFDIVLHHAGNVFEYALPQGAGVQELDEAAWSETPLPILWRDPQGHGDPRWGGAPAVPPADAALFPDQLRDNATFTRRGSAFSNGFHAAGDFNSLKGFAADLTMDGHYPVRDALIRCYQYVIARFDVDAFRIDTLKFVPPDFERIFANAMREFALSAGKKNFFTFGEVYDSEATISQFIGRNTHALGAVVGVDAALDFPLQYVLPNVVKGLAGATPYDLANVFEVRKQAEEDIVTSHGEAGKYFVTFLDNHDQAQRFGYTGPTQLPNQISLGLGCLYSLQGIPCLYYGTEQGLSGRKDAAHDDDSIVREALWGRQGPSGRQDGFDTSHPLYQAVRDISRVRASQPALRYGRQYFRPVSGNGTDFGISGFSPGLIAFSRILNDQEVLVVANTSTSQSFQGEVIVDRDLNPAGSQCRILYSNQSGAGAPGPVRGKPGGGVSIAEVDGTHTNGPACALAVQLRTMEIQMIGH
ncbi:MAG: alpha-amylase [Gammaproteobacteria bacterium]|nr:alpha-amylase [Gammaproteobacteria bacterium]